MNKKIYHLLIGLFAILMNSTAQMYVEDMEASNPSDTGYDNTQFVSSSNGLNWTLNQCRYSSNAAHNIDGRSVLLKAVEGYIQSPVINGGVQKISFQQYRGWSNVDVRTFDLVLTNLDTSEEISYSFSREEGASSVEEYSVYPDISGDFSFKIVNTTSSVVIAIDNIKWFSANSFNEDIEGISDANTGYHSGSYTGVDGLNWSYDKARSAVAANTAAIEGTNSIMINTGWGYILSDVLNDGISELSFSAKQAWSSKDNDRTIKVRIYDETMTNVLFQKDLTYQGLASVGSIQTQQFTVTGVAVTGNCRIQIFNVTSTAGSEILIDDIFWKSNPVSTALSSVNKEKSLADVYAQDSQMIINQRYDKSGEIAVYSISGKLMFKGKTHKGINTFRFSHRGIFIINLTTIDGKSQSSKLVFN